MTMTTLCSLILSLILSLSGGTAGMPDYAEMADVFTLRNVSISIESDYFNQSMEITPDFQLVSQVGAEESQLHFQVNTDEGEVLLPASGKITNNNLQFTIGESDYCFGVSDAMLREAMDDEGTALLNALTAYANLLNTMQGTTTATVEAEVLRVAAHNSGVQPEQTQVEYEGASYAAQKYTVEMTRDELDGLLANLPADTAQESIEAVAIYQAIIDSTTGIADILSEEFMLDAAMNFSDLVAFEVIESEIGGEDYFQAMQKYEISGILYEITYKILGDHTEYTQSVTYTEAEEDYSTESVQVISMITDGPAAAPESIRVDASMDLNSKFSYEDGSESNETHMTMELEGGVADGLWNVVGNMDFNNLNTYNYEYYSGNYRTEGGMELSYTDVSEDDGSISTYLDMDITLDDSKINLDMEFNRARVPAQDYFEGKDLIMLDSISEEDEPYVDDLMESLLDKMDDDLETLGEIISASIVSDYSGLESVVMEYAEEETDDEETAGNNLVTSSELSGHESLRDSIRQSVSVAEEEYDEYDYGEDEYEAEDFTDYMEYSFDVETIEEAAALFSGDFPEFTMPDGYKLESVDMYSEDYVELTYSTGDDYLYVYIVDLQFYGNSYYTLDENGKLQPAENDLISFYIEGDLIFSSEFYRNNCQIMLATSWDADFEDYEAILAGF